MKVTTQVPEVKPNVVITMTLEEASDLWLRSYRNETGPHPRLHSILAPVLLENKITKIEGNSVF